PRFDAAEPIPYSALGQRSQWFPSRRSCCFFEKMCRGRSKRASPGRNRSRGRPCQHRAGRCSASNRSGRSGSRSGRGGSAVPIPHLLRCLAFAPESASWSRGAASPPGCHSPCTRTPEL
ncbi:unnamed protein product, partial [Linum tenue]